MKDLKILDDLENEEEKRKFKNVTLHSM